jgi:hypothetical protein
MTTWLCTWGTIFGNVCKWINVDEHVCACKWIGHMIGIFHSFHIIYMNEESGFFIGTL